MNNFIRDMLILVVVVVVFAMVSFTMRYVEYEDYRIPITPVEYQEVFMMMEIHPSLVKDVVEYKEKYGCIGRGAFIDIKAKANQLTVDGWNEKIDTLETE
jgi:hypothetical protein